MGGLFGEWTSSLTGSPAATECSATRAGYAARVPLLLPLSITGVVLITACGVVIVAAIAGIWALLRTKRGD
ncbi:MAG TPA: hypothetical protein DCM67_10060 [Propionibacteriaceae bacterium]|nr:hypothetical protein [Propionibacteriaceae bacterium]